MVIENWIEVDFENYSLFMNVMKFDVNLKVEKDFGILGVLILKNFYRDEFFFKVVFIKFLDKFMVYFLCNLCVYNIDYYVFDCVFFSNKVVF